MREIVRAIRSGHWPSLAAAWLHFEISFMAWLLIGALGIFIAEEFHLTATQKGLLVASPLLGVAILRIPVGLCSDWFGPKPTGLVLLAGESLVLLWGWLGVSDCLPRWLVGVDQHLRDDPTPRRLVSSAAKTVSSLTVGVKKFYILSTYRISHLSQTEQAHGIAVQYN